MRLGRLTWPWTLVSQQQQPPRIVSTLRTTTRRPSFTPRTLWLSCCCYYTTTLLAAVGWRRPVTVQAWHTAPFLRLNHSALYHSQQPPLSDNDDDASSPRTSTAFSSSTRSTMSTMTTTAAAAADSASSPPAAPSDETPTTINWIQDLRTRLDNSWVRTQLSPETPEHLTQSRQRESLPPDDDNRKKRPVFNGHYVLVQPTGLRQPRLVLWSPDMAQALSLTPKQIHSEDFVALVSGNQVLEESWATPYALSIMGTRYTHNCPYGTGDGYGDGRAISIGEWNGWELQLKGAGTTPFHRGADGRAVLRSSIREFLASEAMHHLHIPTTRALSLVVSEIDTSTRPWYTDDAMLRLPDMDDPRLSQYPEDKRRAILQQLRQEKADPNIMVMEKNAITCRVCSSFVRVGHLDLFARRAERRSMQNAATTDSRYDTSTNEWKELEAMVWHTCYREFRREAYDPYVEKRDIASAATIMLQLSAERIAAMVAGWIRVGFAQGNFNADNCLVGGKTMDYGPFGFMEEYHPLFAKWTGSANHFGFMNQPSAGYANYGILVSSVVPVICAARGEEDPEPVIQSFLEKAATLFQGQVDEVLRVKLGFPSGHEGGDAIWEGLEPLMRKSRTDWTLFFRHLTYVLAELEKLESVDPHQVLEALEADQSPPGAFYETLSPAHRQEWLDWILSWKMSLLEAQVSASEAYDRMKEANPKYVLREWMLVEAYSKAARGDEEELHRLYDLIQHPYEEGSDVEHERYFRRAPDEALRTGGTAFMS